MQTINGQTKRGQSIFRSWLNGDRVYRIGDIYGRYSWDKEKAFDDCFNKYCNEKPGNYDFKCTGHNSFAFSVAWMQEDGNLRYETAGGSYLVILNK